jgi:hypothetical protein
MKSESEAGYEPSLLIEMEGIQAKARQKKTRAKQGSIMHHAYVLKDRWRTLNGRTFTFKDMNDYKAGDYLKVFKAFEPHFDKLAIGKGEQRAVDPTRTSAALFDGNGDSAYQQRARRVQIVLEEIQGTLVKLWPGQDAKSKALKALAIETLFDTRSWTQVESIRSNGSSWGSTRSCAWKRRSRTATRRRRPSRRRSASRSARRSTSSRRRASRPKRRVRGQRLIAAMAWVERFWSFVDQNGPTHVAALARAGAGPAASREDGASDRDAPATDSRRTWVLHNGPIPGGQHVHRCAGRLPARAPISERRG